LAKAYVTVANPAANYTHCTGACGNAALNHQRETRMKSGKWPEISSDPLYQLLHNEEIDQFNIQRKTLDTSHLKAKNYRGLDLREIDASGLDFSDAYFRGADLRGIDFRQTNLEGASMAEAKISGCYFPKELSAEEIRLSVEHGIRVRYRRQI
jgi:uncharacterized protein YjbI with pentapeptide repeats